MSTEVTQNPSEIMIETDQTLAQGWKEFAGEFAWPTVLMGLIGIALQIALATLALTETIYLWGATIPLAVLAYMQFTVLHDAGHGDIAGDHANMKWVEAILGRVCSTPLFLSYPLFRAVHNHHHAHTNDPEKDPDHWMKANGVFRVLGRSLSLLPMYYYLAYFGSLSDSADIRNVRKEATITLVLTITTLTVLSSLGYGEAVLALMVVPAAIAVVFLALVFDWLPHHPHSRIGQYLDTRAILFPGLSYLLLGQNYHVIHHAFPRIPFYRYGQCFWRYREELESKGVIVEGIFKKDARLFSHPWDAAPLDANVLNEATVIEATMDANDTLIVMLQLTGTVQALPGQHVTLSAEMNGSRVSRNYSIVRSLGDKIELGIKRIPDGTFSSWAHRELRKGTRIKLSGPMGDFVFQYDEHGDAPIVCIAGGSGITPIMAILNEALRKTNQPIKLIYASQSKREEIFTDRIDQLVNEFPDRLSVDQLYTGKDGFATQETITELLDPWCKNIESPLTNSHAFLCGPAPFMELAHEGLQAIEIKEKHIHSEEFVRQLPAQNTLVAESEAGYTITFEKSGHKTEVRVAPSASLLDAAILAGLEPEYACEKGMCSTCKCRLIKGEIDHQDPVFGISDTEIKEKTILLCSSRASSEATIRLG